MELKIGDIFWLNYINPRNNEHDRRPVVVWAFEDERFLIAAFATITTSEIEDFDGKYDKWKSPIFRWRDAGLYKESYVKANCIASVDKTAFISEDYIGEMDRVDLNNAQSKIKEFINSDEEPW